MTIRCSAALATAALNSGIVATMTGTTWRINVYTGSQPVTAETAASGTLLGTLTCSNPVFATAAAKAAALNAVTSDTTADATGTAGYVRFYRTGDTAPGSAGSGSDMRMDLDITDDIAMSDTAVIAGGTIALSAWSLNHP
jgi:hypothetical protein